MMRNVAIGAVLGFGAVVLVLSIFGGQPPPPAPAPVAAAAELAADAGAAPVLTPLNVAPVVVAPIAGRDPAVFQGIAEQRAAARAAAAAADGGVP